MTIIANQLWTVEEALSRIPDMKIWAKTIFDRVNRIAQVPEGARVLDVGSASGAFVLACSELGYRGEGIEPSDRARATASELSERTGVEFRIRKGTAEAIPFEPGRFDVVHAASVMEHVQDIDKAFQEIHRVLKPGGVFWFNAVTSIAPHQPEIRGFPLFGWYPNWLKLRIMMWAKDARPHLVGHTDSPAINWYSPWKWRRILHSHGFAKVYDRWDIRSEQQGGQAYAVMLAIIRSSMLTKTLADVAVSGCSFAAVKGQMPSCPDQH
jgi:SAM-dependent methyltransferase